jgi:DNA polymerase family A
MEDRGIWWDADRARGAAGYVAQVEQVRPILAAMEDRGLPINDRKRLGLGAEFDAAERELQEELDGRFPDEARRVKIYKTVPTEVKELLEGLRAPELQPAGALNEKGKPLGKGAREKLDREARARRYAELDERDLAALRGTTFLEVSADDREKAAGRQEERVLLAQMKRGEQDRGEAAAEEAGDELADEPEVGKRYRYAFKRVLVKRGATGDFGEDLTAAGKSADVVMELTAEPVWCRIYAFSPNSAPQLYAYMTAKRHPIPFDRKQKRNTTSKREVLRLGDRFKDDFYAKVIECREVRKMRGTYIDGFRPQADGRAHPTFTFATATQQLSARNPNSQNWPARARLAKAVKSMIEAPAGMELANWDLKSYHVLVTGYLAESPDYMRLARMDMHSFVAWHFLRLPGASGLYALPDDELAEKLSWFKSNKEHPEYKRVRDNQAKPCIAEGQRVLTARGLVPIQAVTIDDKVWDGVEWVNHGGLIDKGIREVITYDGLTATPDHGVFLDNGEQVALRDAASRLARLHVTGVDREAVRSRHRSAIESVAQERQYHAAREMSGVWRGMVGQQGQPAVRRDARMQALCDQGIGEVSASGGARQAIRRDRVSMFLPAQSEVSPLWRTRDHVQVREPERVCAVCGGESPASRLQGSGDRPDRQQRSLRARESEAGYAQATDTEPREHCVYTDGCGADSADGVEEPLRSFVDGEVSSEGNDSRGYYSARSRACNQGEGENVAAPARVARFARVYDLADAGPRKCYTVEGKLVLNCILGIALGLMPPHLYEMNREHFESLKQARDFRTMIESLFPKVFAWQRKVCLEAHQRQVLVNPYGAQRWFYEVYAPDGKGGLKPGDQYNAAMAFNVQSYAHGELREKFKELRRQGLDERFGLVNTIHDSATFCYPRERRDEMVERVQRVFAAPSRVMVHPVLAPGGLTVGVECAVGRNMAELKEVALDEAGQAAGKPEVVHA